MTIKNEIAFPAQKVVRKAFRQLNGVYISGNLVSVGTVRC